MATTVKVSVYMEEITYSKIEELHAKGRLERQRFYNIAIEKALDKKLQEEKILESLPNSIS